MKNLILAVSLFGLSINTIACTIDGSEGFVPDNNLKISADQKSLLNSNLDEAKFNEVIDSVVKIYEPIVASEGGKLNVERNWEDGTVNAYASRNGSTWNVAMFGGLARHKEITPDGFALVVCHELGHHIGGAPRKGARWASNEGQSDYFATLKCLRKVFRSQNNAAILAEMKVPSVVIKECSNQFSQKIDQLICQRSSMAGMSTARLFRSLRRQWKKPKFDRPDRKVVRITSDSHPDTQCRLDTYYTGALCQIDDTIDVSSNDEAVGVCYRKNGDTKGVRPLCWFKPQE